MVNVLSWLIFDGFVVHACIFIYINNPYGTVGKLDTEVDRHYKVICCCYVSIPQISPMYLSFDNNYLAMMVKNGVNKNILVYKSESNSYKIVQRVGLDDNDTCTAFCMSSISKNQGGSKQ